MKKNIWLTIPVMLALILPSLGQTTINITQFTFKGCASYLCQMQPEKQGSIDIANPVTGVTVHFVGRWSGVGTSTQTLNLNNGQFSIITPGLGRLLGDSEMTGYRVLGQIKIVNEYVPNPKSPMDIYRVGLYTMEPIRVQSLTTLQTLYTLTLKDLYAPANITSNTGSPVTYNITASGATGLGVLTSIDITQAANPRDLLKMLSAFYNLPTVFNRSGSTRGVTYAR